VRDSRSHVQAELPARLDGFAAVRPCLEASAIASHGLVLFCKSVPNPLLGWLREDLVGRAEMVEPQLFEICGVPPRP
jgi:hypothetical protein